MECNKEEALRARELAEKKLLDKDYNGAKKMALKAEKLFPQLDNISQLLTVCEVHCSAQLVFDGLHDHYKILQVESTSDDFLIKKQYRKLAFLLHPDKNKLPGAEEAFKLVGVANSTLSDRSKRSLYNYKWERFFRSAGPHQNTNTNTARNSNSTNQPKPQQKPQPQPPPQQGSTFWTACPNCRTLHQYHYHMLSKQVQCVKCSLKFMANPSSHPNPSHMFGAGNQQQFQGQAQKQKQTSGIGGTTMHSTGGVRKPNRNLNPKPSPSNSSGLNTVTGQRRGKRVSADTSESNTDTRTNLNPNPNPRTNPNSAVNPSFDDGKQTDAANSSTPLRRSARFKRDMDSTSMGANISSAAKKARVEVTGKGRGSGLDDETNMNTNASNSEKGKEKVGLSGSSVCEDASRDVNAGTYPSSCIKMKSGAASASENSKATFVYPDPEFCDFDKLKDVRKFAINQIWALYDNLDGMPRFYGRIRHVSIESGFKVKYTWFEHKPVTEAEAAWSDEELPVGCGNYTLGETETTYDRFIFSHMVLNEKDKKKGGPYSIFPRKGEVWAVFKDWDVKWSQKTEKKRTFEYEIVEVLTEFSHARGIKIVPLVKVQGFVSVFARVQNWVPIHVPYGEILKLSHSIPAYRLSGSERDDLPEGLLELDTVALPSNFATAFTSVPIDLIKPQTPCKENNRGEESAKSGGIDPSNGGSSRGADNISEHTTTRSCESQHPHIDAHCEYPDTEFHNFDMGRTSNQFQRGQIWAIYSDLDTYPKYYGYVRKVEPEPFKVHLSWLEAVANSQVERDWLSAEFPVSCGKFKVTHDNMSFNSLDTFSHVVSTRHHRRGGYYEILPEVGEIWAVYKNWSANWTISDFNTCEFDIVEIKEQKDESTLVWPLKQVTGYKTVFMPEWAGEGVSGKREIPVGEYIIFSHRIPAFGLTEERGGKLRGFWELDPASVPDQFLYSED